MKRRAWLLPLTAVLLLLILCTDRWRRARLESSQDRNIAAASRKYGLDPALLKAVMWRESKFNPEARGTKGEVGLMQIMEITGQEWAEAQHLASFAHASLSDPVRNIDCGAWYLQKLLPRYTRTDNPVPYALADYNAGRGNVLRWMRAEAATNSAVFVEQIGFPSTRSYVRAVMERREKYRHSLPWDAPASSKR